MTALGLALGADNARHTSTDARVQLVLLERTLSDPPRLAAMQRWSGAIRRRFPSAEQLPYVWHLVSHAHADGFASRSTRRPAGRVEAFGSLQVTDETQRAWDVSRLCVQGAGGHRIVLRTAASLSPGALGRRRLQAFVEARRAEGIDVIWEPEGLWEPAEARLFARQIGATLLVSAFEGGRPRRRELHGDVLVSEDVWLRVDGTGPRARLDGDQLDALQGHLQAVPDATIIFGGSRALAHLRECAAFVPV